MKKILKIINKTLYNEIGTLTFEIFPLIFLIAFLLFVIVNIIYCYKYFL